MGYYLTIVRTNGEKQNPISKDEIVSLVNSGESYSFEDHGNYLNIRKTSESGQDFYFIYQDGLVWIKNPEPEHVDALVDVAKILGGRVRGDEFETYISSNETFVHPDDLRLIEQAKAISKATKKSRNRRQLFINGSIFLIFGLLALLVGFLSKN